MSTDCGTETTPGCPTAAEKAEAERLARLEADKRKHPGWYKRHGEQTDTDCHAINNGNRQTGKPTN
ncbi:hypothetical protein [Vibrio sp. JZG10]